jgi:hypothetical protein
MGLFLVLFLLPPTPYSADSVLFGQIRKDSLLRDTPAPRIIFVGGSNLSLGLSSRMIKDSLQLNPINTALAAGLGLTYMMRHTLPFVKAGDRLVLIFEYDSFFGENYRGALGYVPRILCDVNKDWLALLHPSHLPYLPKLSFSHINPFEYFYPSNAVYSVNSLNQFGDIEAHWRRPKELVTLKAVREAGQRVNPGAIREMEQFRDSLDARGASMLVSYPCFMETSFAHNEEAIRMVEAAFKQAGFLILGSPERYMMPDSLMYDTHYHLVKQGVDLRTQRLIDDLKRFAE